MAAEGVGPRLELGLEAVGLGGERRGLLAGGGEQVAQRGAGLRAGRSAPSSAPRRMSKSAPLVERDNHERGGAVVDELGLPAEARGDLELAAVVALEEAERRGAVLDEAVDKAQCC